MSGGGVSPSPNVAGGGQVPPRWQDAVVVLSLGLFSLLVVLPLGGLLLLLWTGVVLLGSARWLDAAGALEPGPFGASVYLTIAMLAVTLAASARAARAAARRRATSP